MDSEESAMMRWVVLMLLLCNGIYFAWQRYLAPPSPAGAATVIEPQGQRLLLLSEAGGEAQPLVRPVSRVATTPPGQGAADGRVDQAALQPVLAGAAPEVPAAPVCHMIGPFREKISARQVRDRLAALPVRADLYQIDVPAKPVFWVYLGPMRSRQEAQERHRQLLAKNVESFTISEGPLANGVSLGFFTVAESAQAMLKMRREQGYDAKLREVARTTPEMWLVLGDGDDEKLSETLWQQVRAGTDGVERRKSLCDVVARARKLE
jgi:hypothetical protein